MKKLSLLLALLLALSVCLVACGGEKTDEPADDSSVEAPNDDASTDASDEESDDASDEASDDASEDEGSVDVNGEITGENIAPNATYTKSLLYRQGGREVNWAYDENAPEAYPDEEDASMTDGVFATSAEYSDTAWMGFHYGCPDYSANGYSYINFDLGAATAITGVKAYVGTDVLQNGIAAPASVELYISEDGENWNLVNIATPLNAGNDFGTECVEIAAATSTQYIQLRFIGNSWLFVSEVEIYA